jgi:uncharacterized protein YprB with RNaseH-like and TPR domain
MGDVLGIGEPEVKADPRKDGPVLYWDIESLNPLTPANDRIYAKVAGVGVACVFNATTGLWSYYSNGDLPGEENSIGALKDYLQTASLVVSYNGKWFDNRALDYATGHLGLDLYQQHDIYEIICKRITTQEKFSGGWKLGSVCERTLGIGKAFEGSSAPAWWEQRKIGRLMTYVHRDVQILAKLHEFIRRFGYVIAPSQRKLTLTLEASDGD